jgi:hypothetical protein
MIMATRKQQLGENREEQQRQRRLHPLAQLVRRYYILQHRSYVEQHGGGPCNYGHRPMPRWDGGVDAAGRRYKPVWYGIVRYALDNGVSPLALIRETFRSWRSNTPPWPNMFINQAALSRARQAIGAYQDVRDNLRLSHDIFRAAATTNHLVYKLDLERAAERALHDTYNDLTALYRYCMGVRGEAADVVARFHDAALTEYILDKHAFDAAWGDMIPEALRREGDRFYQEVL